MFVITLVFYFILKLRFPKNKSIATIIKERYGERVLRLYRNCEKIDYKIRKTDEDIKFLTTCKENRLTPKFLHFKLYTRRLQNSSLYRNFQRTLLENELKKKCSIKRSLNLKSSHLFSELQAIVSRLDFNHLNNYIYNHNGKLINNVKTIQSRKLFRLGLTKSTEELDPKNLVLNYSDKILSEEEIKVLAHGLKFGLPPTKINYSKFFLSFEKLFHSLKDNQIYQEIPDGLHRLKTSIKDLAFRNYYSFNSSSIAIDRNFIEVLKNLSSDKSIIIAKPDKGNGIVICNRCDYNNKM